MKLPDLIATLAGMGAITLDHEESRNRRYLEDNGWICLGAESGTGQVHWTNLERGIGPCGPVTFYRALTSQRTKDAIRRMQEENQP